MKVIYKALITAALLAGAGSSFALRGSDMPDPSVLEQENLLRREAEQKIQTEILNRILGEGLATVLVNVEVSLESQHRDSASSEGKVDDNKKLGDQDFILPWVPAPKTVNKANEVPKDAKMESASANAATAQVRQSVSRFDVTIIHDQSVSQGDLTLVDEAIRSAYARFEKTLRVIFKPTRFAKYDVQGKIKEGFWDFLKPQYLLPGLIALMLLLFLFGPLWQFLRAMLKAMTARRESNSDTNMRMEGKNKDEGEMKNDEGEKELTEAEALEQAKKEEEMQKFVPFAYIDEKNIKRLVYLISREPPEVIAIVVSYLKPEFVNEVLGSLSPELQARVAMHMAAVKQTSEAEVRLLDKDIKVRIDYVVGGLHSLIKVLDEMDYKNRDNILEYLKNARPGLYEKVKKHIVMFDDLQNFPDEAMQIIVRELKAESLAKALQDAPPAVSEKVFKNVSKGAAALLKEEMEFSRALTPEQKEEERQKIVAVVKKLEADNRIVIREKVSEDFLDMEDMDLFSSNQKLGGLKGGLSGAAAQAIDPSKWQEYMDSGIQAYDEKQYAQAIVFLQQAVQLNPASATAFQYLGNALYATGEYQQALAAFEQTAALTPQDLELRQWVDQFRASLSTPTGS